MRLRDKVRRQAKHIRELEASLREEQRISKYARQDRDQARQERNKLSATLSHVTSIRNNKMLETGDYMAQIVIPRFQLQHAISPGLVVKAAFDSACEKAIEQVARKFPNED